MNKDTFEVDFFEYCPRCKYKDVPDVGEPCTECLEYPENLYSKKPVKFEEFAQNS